MKIQNTNPKIYFPPNTAQKAGNSPGNTDNAKVQHQQKLNIPKDFAPQKKLELKEQQFFENLFPGAKKEIQNYLKQQNKIVPEKGKYIDMKG